LSRKGNIAAFLRCAPSIDYGWMMRTSHNAKPRTRYTPAPIRAAVE
jgi:hypothetical protein